MCNLTLIQYAIVIHKIQILKVALVLTVPTGLGFYVVTLITFLTCLMGFL